MASPENARVLVEVAIDGVAGARAAAAAGADRLELCAELLVGGLTPSLGAFAAVRAAVAIPVFAMVRPRRGDFLFDADEFDVMLRDVALLREAGADGIVTGVLTADGAIDRERLARLCERAAPLPVTCHRAFDLCADPLAALEELVALGCARVLTSGQAASAPAGAAAIARCVTAARDRLVVVAGAGVRHDNVADLVHRTRCREIHLSATTWRDSAMRFRRDGVPMGGALPPSEYSLRTTDADAVARVVAAR
ncbi:MAG: copper homeostasis protein CutC [Planctomycetota bacterium]